MPDTRREAAIETAAKALYDRETVIVAPRGRAKWSEITDSARNVYRGYARVVSETFQAALGGEGNLGSDRVREIKLVAGALRGWGESSDYGPDELTKEAAELAVRMADDLRAALAGQPEVEEREAHCCPNPDIHTGRTGQKQCLGCGASLAPTDWRIADENLIDPTKPATKANVRALPDDTTQLGSAGARPKDSGGKLGQPEERPDRALIQRLYEERNRNCEIAVGLAERVHHELQDYGGYVRAVDELVGDEDAEVDAFLAGQPEVEPSSTDLRGDWRCWACGTTDPEHHAEGCDPEVRSYTLEQGTTAALPDDTSAQEEREPWTGRSLFDVLLHEADRARNPYAGLSRNGKAAWERLAARIEREIGVARTPQDVLDSDGEREEPEVSCARCAKLLTPGEIVCPNCGTERPQETT